MDWFKHYRGMVTDDKFEEYFEEFSDKAFSMIYMFSLILERATKDKGYFRKGDGIAHDEVSIRAVFRRVKEFYGADFVYDSIERFIADGLIERDAFKMMSVKNWEKYQSSALSTERVKKHRENKKLEGTITEVIDLFNDITGKKYKTTTTSFRDKIRARLEQGFTMEDCDKVISWKFKEWRNDAKMKKYITPDTLFRPGHFDRYLNEIPGNLVKSVSAKDMLTVRDIFGNKKVISKKQFEDAEDGFFTKID